MEMQFVKLNPTENMTIPVESPLERSNYPDITARLMACGSVYAEQTGFIEPPYAGTGGVYGGFRGGNIPLFPQHVLCFHPGEYVRAVLDFSGNVFYSNNNRTENAGF
ncbi:MAG: hypothetical protein LBT16_13305 [Treponema sp.]|nr:hypothetical protein [Treponema sp.]